jgi:MSHA biogenesis protein MshN
MSLINKMLKDLETRQGGGLRGERPIFQDLHSTRGVSRQGRGRWVAVLALLIVGGAGMYFWLRWDAGVASVAVNPAPSVSVTPLPTATPEPSVPVLPVQEKAAPLSVVAKEPAPAAKPKPAKARTSPPVKPQAEKNQVAKSEAGPVRMEKTDRPYSADELAANTYQEAVHNKAQGNSVEAERQLKMLLADQPTHVKARELLAAIHFESGRIPEAQAVLEQGMAQVPTHSAFRYQLARLYLDRGDAARAVSLLEEASRQGLSDPELPAFLAALYQRAGRNADAVKSYQAALAARPQEGRWWVGLGISLETLKNSDAARDAYRHALDTGRLTASLARYSEDRLKALIVR